VVSVERDEQAVILASGERIGYQRLVVATGSNPIIPPLVGSQLANVFAIRKDVPSLQQILDAVRVAKSLCIVGCGFIGVEIAEECRRQRSDLAIHIVEMLHHCLQLVYDDEFCIKAEEALKAQNVSVWLNEEVASFAGNGSVTGVRLRNGQEFQADAIILGIGARANVALAEKAGLEVGPTSGIQVNRYMQTSDPKIYACGDCAEKISFFDGKPSNLKLASIATMEARIAGANLFTTTRANLGVIGVYSTVLGDQAFAAAGLTRAQAEQKGYRVVVGQAESINRHPGCMPGGSPLKVKLLFDAGDKILLGGQVAGAKSGGELINAISACIQQRMTADQIAMFQTGTHPALTASPIAYQLVNAAEMAIREMKPRPRQ
jgi:pyruvate/2-oxoglutarate dehydrogenase complex dihydrolipoamide dehydrogenase (E3) component